VLAPERLKPFLAHDDPDVRTTVADYFSDYWSDDPAVLGGILDAYERYGTHEDLSSLATAWHLGMTAPLLGRVLDLLDRAPTGMAAETLSALVAQAPGPLLHECCDAVEAHPRILAKHLPRIRRRRELVAWPGERLWQELQDFARRSEHQMTVGAIDHDYADDLIEALARHVVPDTDTLVRLLGETQSGWLEPFVIDLAGARRVRGAVPVLAAKLHIDDDYVPVRAAAALGRIADPSVARLIRAEYPTAPFHYRLFACEALGFLKHPESEAAVLALLEQEDDPGARMWLCVALCDLFADRAVELAVTEVETSRSLAVFRELCAPVLVVSKILGVPGPRDAERWERESQRQRTAVHAAVAEPATMPDAADPPPTDGLVEAAVAEPARQTPRRVGRNDPCPCGSGKKYKKCCGQTR
jgi:hypothetical protein